MNTPAEYRPLPSYYWDMIEWAALAAGLADVKAAAHAKAEAYFAGRLPNTWER